MPRARLAGAAALLTLLLPLLAGSGPLWAQEREEELEEWQRRILRALEEAGESERAVDGEAESESYRGSAPDEGAAAAAEEARQRYGGRVLAVGRVGRVYRVRLLLESGRVVTVEVE